MRTIEDAIRQLHNTADILMDRSVRAEQRGDSEQAAAQRDEAKSYRLAAKHLEQQMKRDTADGH